MALKRNDHAELEMEIRLLQEENDLARKELFKHHGHHPLEEGDDLICCECPLGFRDWRRTPLADLLEQSRSQQAQKMYEEYVHELELAGLKPPALLTNQ